MHMWKRDTCVQRGCVWKMVCERGLRVWKSSGEMRVKVQLAANRLPASSVHPRVSSSSPLYHPFYRHFQDLHFWSFLVWSGRSSKHIHVSPEPFFFEIFFNHINGLCPLDILLLESPCPSVRMFLHNLRCSHTDLICAVLSVSFRYSI